MCRFGECSEKNQPTSLYIIRSLYNSVQNKRFDWFCESTYSTQIERGIEYRDISLWLSFLFIFSISFITKLLLSVTFFCDMK